MLLLDPKGATNTAVRLPPMPKGAAMHFKAVAAPSIRQPLIRLQRPRLVRE